MALDNQSTTLSSTQCQTTADQGNVTINGNVTLSAGAVWADSQALLEGNPTISVGSVTGNTVVLGGKVSITWNPKNGGIRGIPYLTP
jgi:formylmethanofuran dehydrogenase subunit C